MPNALTMAATPEPSGQGDGADRSGVVSATTVSRSGCGVNQRLNQQPLAHKPGAEREARTRRARPLRTGSWWPASGGPNREQVKVTQPGRGQHRAGGQKPEALEPAWATRCNSAAAIATVAGPCAPVAASRVAAPSAR